GTPHPNPGRSWRARRHGAPVVRHGLGEAAVAALDGGARRWSLLPWPAPAVAGAGAASPARLSAGSLVSPLKDRILLRRLFSCFALLCLSLGATAPALAQMPAPPEVAARAYLLLDVTSGQVLASKDPDQ